MGGSNVNCIDAGPVEDRCVVAGSIVRSVLSGKFIRAILAAGAYGYQFGIFDALQVGGEAMGDLAEAEDGPVEGGDGC